MADTFSSHPASDTETATDRIYANPQETVAAFSFDETVARVFPDMIKRSVPGYEIMLEMITLISARYARANTRLYDLGCSLGASTLAMAEGLKGENCQILAIDNSPAMIDRGRTLYTSWPKTARSAAQISFHCQDIRDIDIHCASLVALNFTLQFLPEPDKKTLIANIAHGLLPGGALILSEKLCFSDPQSQHCLTELHHAFKRNRGYSDLEIAQKRSALENVLLPETLQTHRQRLLDAGFAEVHLWFQCFNFMSLLAVK
jgi:tRNA (cmo5U34)-methyltransferase